MLKSRVYLLFFAMLLLAPNTQATPGRRHTNRPAVAPSSTTPPQKPSTPTPPPKKKKKDPRKAVYLQEEKATQRAWLYSMILPGLGQYYNRRYWKIATFYAGWAVAGSIAWHNHKQYKKLCRQRDDLYRHSPEESKVNKAKRDRNLWLIIASFWYLIHIFDAYADSSMTTFTLSDSISLSVQPNTQQPPTTGAGLQFTWHFFA